MEDLESQISGASWFAKCGQFQGESGAVPISLVATLENWDWLPTSKEQGDPVNGASLLNDLDSAEVDQFRQITELKITQKILMALRSIPDRIEALQDGPHNFTPAAKEGAILAARFAVREIIALRPGFWCRVMRLYAAGYWPCGVFMESEQLVVL